MSVANLTRRVIEPLADVEIEPAIAALPKADIHLHSEAGPRLEQVIAERCGERVTDWRAHARELMRTLPPGMPRLETWGPDLPLPRATVDELDRPPDNFKARVARILVEAALDGAVLVEVLFGGSTILREDFLDLFGEALAEARSRFPRLQAVPLVAAKTTEEWAATLLPRCIAGARRGLAGLNILPAPFDRPADWSVVHGWAERACDAGLGITAHAGEFGTLHLAEALEVPGLTRIGHAIGAASDDRLLDRIAEREVTIECPLFQQRRDRRRGELREPSHPPLRGAGYPGDHLHRRPGESRHHDRARVRDRRGAGPLHRGLAGLHASGRGGVVL